MIKIACIDDEKEFQDTISSYLGRYCEEKNIDFHIDFFNDGMDFLLDRKSFYNLMFIDIRMPQVDGMVLAKKIREYDEKCVIVFITSLQNYAIKGYEVRAFDYILKPLAYRVFACKLDRIIPAAVSVSSKSVVVTADSQKKKISVSDIVYIETGRHNITYHTLTEEINEWRSMKDAAEEFRAYGFELCNSCYLVNLRYVEKISGNVVTVCGGTQLQMSRSRKKSFLDAFTSFSM